jgi:hypothetical protein
VLRALPVLRHAYLRLGCLLSSMRCFGTQAVGLLRLNAFNLQLHVHVWVGPSGAGFMFAASVLAQGGMLINSNTFERACWFYVL